MTARITPSDAGLAGSASAGAPVTDTGPTTSGWVLRAEAALVAFRPYFIWVQAAMFVLFLVVVVVPLYTAEPDSGSTPLNDLRTGLSYLLWGLWFPLVFLSVVLVGRLWCGLLCPMGAAAEWVNKFGLKRRIPGWMRWEGTPAIAFILTTLYGQTLGVRDHPEGAAMIFGVTMAAALLTGFVYGRDKRAWCRHLCPIGRVLGLYSRLGAAQFVPRRMRAAPSDYTERGPCPTMIDLPSKCESRHCIACFRCVQPKAAGSVRLEMVRPGLETETIRQHNANPAEAWLLFLDTGVALGGFLWLVMPQYQDMRQGFGEWAIGHGFDWILSIGPAWLMSVHPDRGETFMWLDFIMIVSFMLGCMIALTGILGAFTGAAAWLSGRAGGSGSFNQRFTELGYQYAPVALMSLIIGLGALMLDPIRFTVFGDTGVHVVRGGLFALGIAWSLWLGGRILANQGLTWKRGILPLIPGFAGSLAVGLCWWPAIFGI
jgi:polyferredoxin